MGRRAGRVASAPVATTRTRLSASGPYSYGRPCWSQPSRLAVSSEVSSQQLQDTGRLRRRAPPRTAPTIRDARSSVRIRPTIVRQARAAIQDPAAMARAYEGSHPGTCTSKIPHGPPWEAGADQLAHEPARQGEHRQAEGRDRESPQNRASLQQLTHAVPLFSALATIRAVACLACCTAPKRNFSCDVEDRRPLSQRAPKAPAATARARAARVERSVLYRRRAVLERVHAAAITPAGEG